jgi:hypothetical protein
MRTKKYLVKLFSYSLQWLAVVLKFLAYLARRAALWRGGQLLFETKRRRSGLKVMTDDRNRTSVLRQLAALQKMKLSELQEKWRDLYGAEPPNFKSTFLKKRLAYRIQELFYGGLEESVKAKLKEIASNESQKTKSKVG